MARVETDSTEDENNDVEVIIEDDEEAGDEQDILDDDSEITSEDDDNDLAEEVALEREAEQLTTSISQDPYNYELHSKLIRTLHQLNDLERLREAFEQLRSRAVPDADLWIRRLNIEALLAHTEQQQGAIQKLYEEAMIDCYSAELHIQWVRFSKSWSSSAELGPASACPLTGHSLHAIRVQHAKEMIGNSETPDFAEKVKNFASILENALSRPLMGIDTVLSEFTDMTDDMMQSLDEGYVERVKEKCNTAKVLLQDLLAYEDKLLSIEEPQHDARVSKYIEYIDYVHNILDDEKYRYCCLKDLLLVLFDRSTYECMTSIRVTDLFDKIISLSKALCDSNEQTRLLRMCARRGPRKSTYHVQLMTHLEKNGAGLEEIKKVLEQSLSVGMETVLDYESVWWSYLIYLRRNTDWKTEMQVERMRDTLKLAWDSLGQTWGDEADTECRILQFWARMEYELCIDQIRGRQVVEQMLQIGDMKHRCTSWQFLLGLERGRGAPPHKIRSIFERGVKHTTDYPPALLKEYVDFERLHGTLDNVLDAEKLCKDKTEEWRKTFDAQKEAKQQQKPKSKSGKDGEQRGMKRRMNDEGGMKDDRSGGKKSREDERAVKRKPNLVGEASGSKKARSVPIDDNSVPKTLFVSNLPHKVDEQRLRKKVEEFGDVESLRLVQGVKAFGGSIAYCTFTCEESLEKALLADRTPFSGRPMFLSRAKPSSNKSQEKLKFATSQEKHKLFVKRLPYSHCSKAKLTELFQSYGGLKEIRTVTFKDGKPKGMAYIEFEDVESSTKALEATNGMEVDGHKIQVAYSDPPIRQPTSYSTDTRPYGSAEGNQSTGMKRTKITCMLPRALAVANASQQQNTQNGHTADKTTDDKPKTNADFRNMLLKK